jgi:hypothetical protein
MAWTWMMYLMWACSALPKYLGNEHYVIPGDNLFFEKLLFVTQTYFLSRIDMTGTVHIYHCVYILFPTKVLDSSQGGCTHPLSTVTIPSAYIKLSPDASSDAFPPFVLHRTRTQDPVDETHPSLG